MPGPNKVVKGQTVEIRCELKKDVSYTHLIYKEGEAYKVTVFRRSGLRRKLKPETYLLQEENVNLFMNTGFRIDVSYNEATDVLTFSPNGDYVRVKPQPGHPTRCV